VLSLAVKVLARVAELTGDASLGLAKAELLPVSVVTDQLGRGYPHPTVAGTSARATFAGAGWALLDDTYSAKAAAHLLASVAGDAGPVVFWCTKSSAPLPAPPEV